MNRTCKTHLSIRVAISSTSTSIFLSFLVGVLNLEVYVVRPGDYNNKDLKYEHLTVCV